MTDTPFCAHAAEPLSLEEELRRTRAALAEEERRNDELADQRDHARAEWYRLREFLTEGDKERLDSEFGWKRRAEAAEARLAALEAPAADAREKPTAWVFELARIYPDSKTYTDFGSPQLSFDKPCVPQGAIRNLQPLYTLSASPAAAMREALEAIQRMARTGKNVGDLGDWRGLFAAIDEKTDGLLRALPLPAPEPVGAEADVTLREVCEALGIKPDTLASFHTKQIMDRLRDAEAEVEEAWDAFGTAANRRALSLSEQIAATTREAERASSAETEIERYRVTTVPATTYAVVQKKLENAQEEIARLTNALSAREAELAETADHIMFPVAVGQGLRGSASDRQGELQDHRERGRVSRQAHQGERVMDKHSGQAVIEDGAIVIRVAIDHLPAIVEGAWMAGYMDTRFKVTNSATFAKALVTELNSESEDGTTLIHKLFDACINEAVEQGAEGIDEHEDQEV